MSLNCFLTCWGSCNGRTFRRRAHSPTARRSRSGLDADDMSLNLAVHGAVPEPPRDGLRCGVGRFAEPGGVPCLDLVAQRRSLAIGNGGNPRGLRPAALRESDDLGRRLESALRKVSRNRCTLVIAVRRARKKARRILRKNSFHRDRDKVTKIVRLD